MLLELREKGEGRFDRLPLRAKTGEVREVEVVANAYWENSRSVIQCNVRDVTERNRLERKTREQAAALADLDRRKDEFLAMLSHELRNPLAPIANAVQLLRLRQPQEGTIEEQARSIIERQVAQLSHLVDDLLEVSRITSGRFQLRQQDVALNDVVERAVETVDASGRAAPARAHARRSRRSRPGCAATPRGSSRWSSTCSPTPSSTPRSAGGSRCRWRGDDGCVVLRVRDTGIGIAPDLLPRIFDLFTQADRSLDRSEGGLGIGLSLVRRLVELHGGTVRASSTMGKGSEFVVRLPTVAAPGSPRAGAERRRGRARRACACWWSTTTSTPPRAWRCCCARKATRSASRTTGRRRSAPRASFARDAIFLDIGLPGLDGFEVAKRLRREPGRENVLLVAMTGYGQQSDRDRSLQAGFDHHLVKPAEFARVRQILASVALATRRRAGRRSLDRGSGEREREPGPLPIQRHQLAGSRERHVRGLQVGAAEADVGGERVGTGHVLEHLALAARSR